MALAPRKRTWGDLGVRERHRSLLTESERERELIRKFLSSLIAYHSLCRKVKNYRLSFYQFFLGGGGHSPEI